MNDFEAVVADYLAADGSVFVNTQCLIQLNVGSNPDTSGAHWYCDAVAVDFRHRSVFLCETSFELRMGALVRRLKGWLKDWEGLSSALRRDSHLPTDWPIRAWLFVPETCVGTLVKQLRLHGLDHHSVLRPRITPLELTLPWKYRSWDRQGEADKRGVPEEFWD